MVEEIEKSLCEEIYREETEENAKQLLMCHHLRNPNESLNWKEFKFHTGNTAYPKYM